MMHHTKNLFVIGVVTLLAALVVYAGAWFIVTEHRETVHNRLNERATLAGKHLGLAALSNTYDKTKEGREALSGYLISDDEVTQLLELIEKTAKEEGLTVSTKSIHIEPMGDSPLFESLVLALEVEGTFPDVVFMLKALEALPFQTSVPSVSLDRLGGDSDAWRGTFGVTITKTKKTP